MRTRILSAVAALAVLAGLGLFVRADATAAPSAAPVLSTTERGLCIKTGTGEPRSLWLVAATGLCPAPYWGPASLEDAFGITLPTATPAPAKAPVASDPVKREVSATVNVDFDASKPLSVTGLPAFRLGSPELWGDNTGSIADAAADIVVKRLSTSATSCPAAAENGQPPASGLLDVPRAVGSTVQKFCAYPIHRPASGGSTAGFLAGQSYKLAIWVYAP